VEKGYILVPMGIGMKEGGRTTSLQGMERPSTVTSNHTKANFLMGSVMERERSSKMAASISDSSKMTR
jgi:hypothetical protein